MNNPTTVPLGHFLKFDKRAGEIIEFLAEHNTPVNDYGSLLTALCEKDAIYETALLIAVLESRHLIEIKQGN